MKFLAAILLLFVFNADASESFEKSAGEMRAELYAWAQQHPNIHVVVQLFAANTGEWTIPPTRNGVIVYRVHVIDRGRAKNLKALRHGLAHVLQMDAGKDPNTPDNEWEAHKAEEVPLRRGPSE